jgi:hypothetical protein
MIWEGQIIQVQGRDYTIDSVRSLTVIRLREPFRGTTAAADTTWRIKHRFYSPPPDCIEMLYLGHRDTPAVGKQPPFAAVRGLMSRREEDLNLREDFTTFFSEAYIPVGTVNVPPAEKLSISVNDAGVFPAGTYMEFCWAFEGEGGKLGPLSQPAIAQISAQAPGAFVLTFQTFDGVTVASPVYINNTDQIMNQWEGLRKRIFFNQNFNRSTGVRLTGLPVWRDVQWGANAAFPATPGLDTQSDPVRVLDTVGTYTITNLDQVLPGNPRYLDGDGQHFRFRPYPRPIGSDFVYLFVAGSGAETPVSNAPQEEFRRWEMRYYRKPVALGLQTDSPEMPYEFHQLIVYKVLHDIYSKHDNLSQAQNYQKKYETELERLEDRYVDSIDMTIQRGQFGGMVIGQARFDPASLRKTN